MINQNEQVRIIQATSDKEFSLNVTTVGLREGLYLEIKSIFSCSFCPY